jgi:hypothetical protein
MEMDPTTEAAMKTWIAANPQGKHGAHSYSREAFGLSDSLIDQAFGEYMERFRLAEQTLQS